MKILIAGGAGFIGSVLVPRLMERGYDVEVLDLLWFGNNLPSSVKVIERDVFKVKEQDLDGYDQVIFLDGLSNDPMAEYSPARNFVENSSAPTYLSYIAKRAGVKRFIHGGSCSVYGYTVNELYDEDSPTISNYPYGISKLQGELGALKMQDEKFSVIAIRKGTAAGYSPRMRLDLVVNAMFKSAIADNIIIVNNPAIWRPILAIEDAASAYIRAVEANQSISGVFNVASGNYTVGEIADYVKDGVEQFLDIHPRLEIRHIQDFRNYKVSIKKANEILSYKPRYDIVTVVKQLVANLEKFKDFTNMKYYNIQVFKSLQQD